MREPRYPLPRVVSDANGMRRDAGWSAPFPGRQRAPLSVSVPWRLRRRGLVAGGGLGRAVCPPPLEFVPTGSRVALSVWHRQ